MNFKFLMYSAGLLIMMRQTKVTVRKKRISEHEGSGRICVNLYICCRKVMNPLWKRHQHMQKKKKNPNHIFEECRPNGFSILWEDKASCEQSSYFTSNGVWAYKMCIWQLVAYKKSECLGNGFMRTSRNLFESKTLFLYLFLDEGVVGCVSSMRIAHIHESLPSCRNWEQKYTSCWADTSWNT